MGTDTQATPITANTRSNTGKCPYKYIKSIVLRVIIYMPTIYPGQLIKPGGYSTRPRMGPSEASLLYSWYVINKVLHKHLPHNIERKILEALNIIDPRNISRVILGHTLIPLRPLAKKKHSQAANISSTSC